MATIQGLLRPILRRQELERYDGLADTLLAADIAPATLERTAAVRSVVCALTSVQPTEFDKLSKLEQLPYLQQAAAKLAKPHGTSTTAETEVIEKFGRPPSEHVAKRREEVMKRHGKGMKPGEIEAELRALRSSGKLSADIPLSVDIVKQDIGRSQNATK